jgi:hypothetical protein
MHDLWCIITSAEISKRKKIKCSPWKKSSRARILVIATRSKCSFCQAPFSFSTIDTRMRIKKMMLPPFVKQRQELLLDDDILSVGSFILEPRIFAMYNHHAKLHESVTFLRGYWSCDVSVATVFCHRSPRVLFFADTHCTRRRISQTS